VLPDDQHLVELDSHECWGDNDLAMVGEEHGLQLNTWYHDLDFWPADRAMNFATTEPRQSFDVADDSSDVPQWPELVQPVARRFDSPPKFIKQNVVSAGASFNSYLKASQPSSKDTPIRKKRKMLDIDGTPIDSRS
jgi:hypothetical protein